jgi:hypothetical protein
MVIIILTIIFVFIFYVIFFTKYWNQISNFLAGIFLKDEKVIAIKNEMHNLDGPISESKIDISDESSNKESSNMNNNIFIDKIKWIVQIPFDFISRFIML